MRAIDKKQRKKNDMALVAHENHARIPVYVTTSLWYED